MKETFKKILVNITVLFNYCNFCIKIHQFLFKYNESIISPEWGKIGSGFLRFGVCKKQLAEQQVRTRRRTSHKKMTRHASQTDRFAVFNKADTSK